MQSDNEWDFFFFFLFLIRGRKGGDDSNPIARPSNPSEPAMTFFFPLPCCYYGELQIQGE